ncbi:MAG: IS66 family transposase [Treponema sp.]|nr:IS66 family transposase [Treponema sp.]
MQVNATQLKTLDTTSLINYIQELESKYNQRLKEMETDFKNLQFDHELLQEKYKLAMLQKFSRSAEQLMADKNQPLLFGSEEEKTETGKKEKAFEEIKSYKRKKPGRKAIDPNIPREEKIIDIEESEKTCACGEKLTKIGEETNEKLHIEPPRMSVIKTIRPKYACRKCEGTEDEESKTIRIAPVEPVIIPRGIATPGLLSWIMTYKYEHHLPFYRQELVFEKIMVNVSRQNMSNWQQQVYDKIKPLFILMKETLKNGPVIQTDETEVQVIGEEERSYTQKSYMWLSRGGPPDKPVTMYQYRKTRKAENVREILEGYSGYLQTDGYIGYDSALGGNNNIIHVGCFAHVRRKFFEAAKVSSRRTTAEQGVNFIKKLYVIENELRNKYPQDKTDDEIKRNKKHEDFLNERKKCCMPVLTEFKSWLIKLQAEVPESTLLGKAVYYALSQWEKLIRYVDSPYLTPDNNACENAIRPFVIGRKNWLFSQSPYGAESSCGMYSLIQTAKQNGLNSFEYLKSLFEKAPYASSRDDWEKLLPWNIYKS